MLDYTTEWGDRNEETVVMLPSAGATRWAWSPHAERLGQRYHVVGLDLPGHGTHPLASFEFERAVEDVGTVLQDIGGGVVVGHSMGGHVALRAAAEHEAMVDGLVAAGAAMDASAHRVKAISVLALVMAGGFRLAAEVDSLWAWVDKYLEDVPEEQQPPECVDTHDEYLALSSALRAGAFSRPWRYAEQYDGAAMIVQAENEAFGDLAEALADRMDARLVWMAGEHEAPATRPKAFVEHLDEFLDGVDEERASV